MNENKLTISEVIELYTEKKLSIRKISNIFKVNHKKISEILISQNISLNKKGGQIKNGNSEEIEKLKTKKYFSVSKDLIAVCKKTGTIINDPNNLSGKLTKHILINYGDIKIPSNNYQRKKYELDHHKKWFEEYFDIVEIEKKESKTCKLCNWSTTDLENRTGSLTKHIIKEHNYNINDYLIKFPEEKKLFTQENKNQKKIKEFILQENYVICSICGEKMKSVNNKHLKEKHGISVLEYKLKYPGEKIVSKKTSNKLSTHLKKINENLQPTWTSKGEIEIKEFIESLGFQTEKSKNRKILEGKEIDLIIPEKKIGIEYNGLYYHTENMGKNYSYHLNKLLESNQVGYKLIQIFEDEWMTKKDLVKEKLKHIFGKNDGIKIGARNTEIRKITKEEKGFFLNKNHIQGNDKSDIFYGSFYNDILVGVMSFNSKRNLTKSKENEYELSRFAIKSGYIVSGLASKIINAFILDYSPKSIISFADRRWTLDGNKNLYTTMGFKLTSIIKPTYFYYNSKFDRYKRFHKFSFGKSNLKKKFIDIDLTKSESEITKSLGFSKIWDCGLFKYELTV